MGEPLANLFRQGLRPEQIVLTLVLGVCLSLFPVLGTTTLLCAAAAVKFRLNLPAIQAVNWLFGGPQLLLLLPFMRVGEWLFRAPARFQSAAELKALAEGGPLAFLGALQWALVYAVACWLAVVVPLGALAYWTAIESWFERPGDVIEFTIRRLPTSD